jgi:isoamylase
MYTIDNWQRNKPYPLGVSTEFNHTYFSVVMKEGKNCGIILYDKKTGREKKIPFGEQNKFGSIYSMAVKDLDINRYAYNFYDGNTVFTDPYAKVILGHEKWGKQDGQLKGGFSSGDYSWEEDKPLKIPYENSILYCLNVRAFTKHKSSGIAHKGTFRGITEKIPYLKELGITAIELMPAYEFDEIERPKTISGMSMKDMASSYMEKEKPEAKYNCWGYKEGYYFAPKAAFCSEKDVTSEFKDMVKSLHENGIEVIMQFYFPNTVKQGLILDVVKFWVLEYHIDGVHLKGEQIPLHVLGTEPLLTDTKLFYYNFPYGQIYDENEVPKYRNLASYQDDYMYIARRFLKGDDGILGDFLERQRKNPKQHGIINYITNYYGFSLADMVSYEKKHNEANGENNRDGNDCNYTWNCGMEGNTRKKNILELRKRQMKNAVTMLFMSQGTPLIYSGDELGNTRLGNNNPYCQDNETGWVKWNRNSLGNIIFNYVKDFIRLKKSHPILHNPGELKILDYIGCGYPDLSYHGKAAWRPELESYSRHAGAMYCGFYAKNRNGENDDFFYIAYNMHWTPHTFALPNLPKGMAWYLLTDTGKDGKIEATHEAETEQQHVDVEPRTIRIYISKQEEGASVNSQQQYDKSAF